ncbi:PREDICTED: uncharacterized protein LOC108609476 [Drosophila arizonae]|uniref:Uncharacterized protein LOC108609476 n=1 Tax=Drosophila arizonae TaxID=7263 RepID=A0ABM1NNZ9_DROAR|nr:PREDICTED: uncharacterized protein LOC108609476 [Drosophila arizonae]
MENTVALDDVVLNPLANANGKRNAEEANNLESAPKKPRIRKGNSQRWNDKENSNEPVVIVDDLPDNGQQEAERVNQSKMFRARVAGNVGAQAEQRLASRIGSRRESCCGGGYGGGSGDHGADADVGRYSHGGGGDGAF